MKRNVIPSSIALSVVALIVALSACDSGRTLEWKQEAPLADGRMIVIDRVSKQTSVKYPERAIFEFQQILSFTNPDTGERISWEIPNGTGAWMIDFDNGRPYMILKTKSVTDYNNFDCPNPPWLAYRYAQSQWDRIPLESLPSKFEKPNLLPAARTDERSSNDGFVSRTELDSFFERQDSEYRIIGREKISPIGYGCHESTLIRLNRQSEIDNRR